MSDSNVPPRVDLSWLVPQSAEEWRSAAETISRVRLMLAGLGLRHAMDLEGKLLNEALGRDIALMQVTMQEAIDLLSANAQAMRDLEKALERQQAIPKSDEVIH